MDKQYKDAYEAPVGTARTRLAELVEETSEQQSVFILTRMGRPKAAVIPIGMLPEELRAKYEAEHETRSPFCRIAACG